MEYVITFPTSLEEINPENDNIDVFLDLKDGTSYTFVVCTPDNLKELMKRDGVPYCQPGYPFLVVERITKENVERLIEELIESGDLFLKIYGTDLEIQCEKKVTKKRVIRFLLTICAVLLLVCCFGPERYRFSQSADQIVSIDIVDGMTEKDAGHGNFGNAVVLASIPEEEWDQVVNVIGKIECHTPFGDPLQSLGGKIFRITYKDGGIELVGRVSGYYYRWNEDGIGKFKMANFDEELFQYLLEHYLNEFGEK